MYWWPGSARHGRDTLRDPDGTFYGDVRTYRICLIRDQISELLGFFVGLGRTASISRRSSWIVACVAY